MKFYLTLLSLLLVIPVSDYGQATTPDKQGYDIAKKSQAILFAYKYLKVDAFMEIYQGDNKSSDRNFRLITSEMENEKAFDKARIDVSKPKSLEGVVLLSWSSPDGREQQWIYTPRIKQTRRIGDNSRKALFINSDFTYEDLLRWQLENYEYQFIKSEACEKKTCQIVKALPKKSYSNYSKLITWYDDLYRILRVDYYDKHGNLKKRLLQHDYKLFNKKYWQPTSSEMIDISNNTKTIIIWSGFSFDDSFSTIFFNASQLGNS